MLTIKVNPMNLVLLDIIKERKSQDEKWGSQRDLDPLLWNAILGEEVGEVSKAILENDEGLYDELIQVAAVATAWAEAIRAKRL
jgi:NTP pyrophosphatase (non-canonical NTP hydrolase)